MKYILHFSPFVFLIGVSDTANGMAQSAPVQIWTTKDLVGVEDGQFRCPESYASVSEKTRAMESFLAWTRSRYPDWTVEQIVTFRMATLKHYACLKTLSNIREAAD